MVPVTAVEVRRFLRGLGGLSWADLEDLAAAMDKLVPDFVVYLAVRAQLAYWSPEIRDSDPALRRTIEKIAISFVPRPSMEPDVREAVAFFWETLAEGCRAGPPGPREVLLRTVLEGKLSGPLEPLAASAFGRAVAVLDQRSAPEGQSQ
jgi:hypothetical protein